jgi:hypothetical protein
MSVGSITQAIHDAETRLTSLQLPLLFKVLRVSDPSPIWLKPETTKIKVNFIADIFQGNGVNRTQLTKGNYTAKLEEENETTFGLRKLILYRNDEYEGNKVNYDDIYIITDYPFASNYNSYLFESLFKKSVEDITPKLGGAKKKSKKVTRKRSRS